MVVLRLAFVLLMPLSLLPGAASAFSPSTPEDKEVQSRQAEVNDIFSRFKMTSVAAPPAADVIDEAILDEDDVIDVPTLADLDDLNDVDRTLDASDGLPQEAPWRLPVRDALGFRFWPADLDQGNANHRRAMDLIERGIIPLKGDAFVPETRVTRIQLIDWLAQVEDWVRVAQTGLSLETKLTVVKRSSPIVTLLRLGLVTPQRPLDGEQWVDRAFELRVLDGLERAWGVNLLEGRPRLSTHSEPSRLEVALWLREIAQDLNHGGHAPTGKVDARSLAHLTIVLTLLDDGSVTVREMAHRALADADPAIIATLLAGRKSDWFRDPVALETLPELAIKLGLAPGRGAAGQFNECMRILRGLKDEALETRFVRGAQDALRKLPLHQPLPPLLMSEIVGILAERGWTEQLDTLLLWGMPALEALVPYLENQSLDRHWSERMPYSIEPGWDSRGEGVVAQLRVLVKNPRIPASTRASALDRLDRLGEAMPRDQMRALGLTPDNDADAARARLARVARCIMDKTPAPATPRPRPMHDEAEVQRLIQMVRTYQFYLAIALGIIALITLAHVLVLLPLMMLRIFRKVRKTLGVIGSRDGCGK